MKDDRVIHLDRLEGCARCHGDGHDNLSFIKLTHSIPSAHQSVAYTHWTLCPTNGEPILLQVFPDNGSTRE